MHGLIRGVAVVALDPVGDALREGIVEERFV
jgi:hypothetical protein